MNSAPDAFQPPSQPQSPPPLPKNNSTRNIVIIVVAVIVVLCCLCALVGGAGAALFNIRSRSNGPAPFENGQPIPIQPTLDEPPVPTEEPSATPETIQIPAPPDPSEIMTQVAGPAPSATGLGFSQAELMQFFQDSGGFTFGEPFTVQGQNAVMGKHPTICVQSDCAAVTLLGPEEDIQAVSVVVPIDPKDQLGSLTAITVLMNSVVKFATDGSIPAQMMSDLVQAQTAGSSFEKSVTDHGYTLTYNYDPKAHQAGLAVSRKK